MKLKAGDPLNLVAMDSTIMLLHDALWERGHADARIDLDTTQVSDVSNAGPVTINITPGALVHVGPVQFTGNRKVSDETIARLLMFKTGDLFTRSTILGSQRNLYLSGLFSELEIETAPMGDTLRLVRVRVVEADLNRLALAGRHNDGGLRAVRCGLHAVQLLRECATTERAWHGCQPPRTIAQRAGHLLRRHRRVTGR